MKLLLAKTMPFLFILLILGCGDDDDNENPDGAEAAQVSAITGTVISGQELTVSAYGEGAASTDGHQWYADGVTISGATSTSYVITSAEEGKQITLRVNGSLDSNALSNFYPNALQALFSWFDPADVSTVTETSGVVSAVADRSSSGNDATIIGSPSYY